MTHQAVVSAVMVFDSETREDAESFVNESPYLRAHLYEDHQLYEYANEIG